MMADTSMRHAFGEIDDTVLNTLGRAGLSYWGSILLLALGIVIGGICWIYQIFIGIGVGGQNNPVVWGTYLINFVFWVGIAHSGTLISAILHLFRAGWRNPIARAAETMTVFAVCVAGLFPFIHLGRVWMVYYMLPIPNQRDLWPNFQSPLMFDVIAISSYLSVSLMFWYTGLLPDLATVRDRSKGMKKKIFTVLSLGWTGGQRQWIHHGRAYLFFAALATPLVISVHSVGVMGFRPWGGSRLAYHHLCPLFCRRGHPFGACNGDHLDDSAEKNFSLRAVYYHGGT